MLRLPEVVLSSLLGSNSKHLLRRAERHRYATSKHEFFYRRMTSGVKFVHARIAAGNGDLSTVEAWLSQGGDLGIGRSSTLLSDAIIGSQTQMCEYLVAQGARCGKSDIYRLLDEILECPSHIDVARLFIEHGADPATGDSQTKWGTPHKLAVIVGRGSLAGRTHREREAQSRYALLIRFLVEKGAPVDARLGEGTRFAVGTTPLMVAVIDSPSVFYLRELLRLGADLAATNEDGESALSLARREAKTEEWRTSYAHRQAVLKFLSDVSAAGTYKRYVNEPRKQLLLLAKLCERRRATAPWGVLRRLFPTRRSRRAPPRDDGGSFQRASAETLRTRRVVSVADRFRGLTLVDGEGLPDELIWKVLSFWRTSRDGRPL